MVNPRELRIGNLILDQKGDIVTVEALEKHLLSKAILIRFDDTGLIDSRDIEPIPLTEEWLVKFGFEKSFDGIDKITYIKKGFEQLADYGGQMIVIPKDANTPYLECGYYNNIIDCEYIHQLQNLYFALTGEELELKD